MDRATVYCSLMSWHVGVEGYERVEKDMRGKR